MREPGFEHAAQGFVSRRHRSVARSHAKDLGAHRFVIGELVEARRQADIDRFLGDDEREVAGEALTGAIRLEAAPHRRSVHSGNRVIFAAAMMRDGHG
jgi:hypothetical protein